MIGCNQQHRQGQQLVCHVFDKQLECLTWQNQADCYVKLRSCFIRLSFFLRELNLDQTVSNTSPNNARYNIYIYISRE